MLSVYCEESCTSKMIIPSGEKLPDNALEKYLKISKNLVKVCTIAYSQYTCYFTWSLQLTMSTVGILLLPLIRENVLPRRH